MTPLQAVIVGFVFVSFLQDSFEADFTSVPDLKAASDIKVFLKRRAICKSLCRSKSQDITHFEKEMSMDMCISNCVDIKREGIHQGHEGRSRRNAYKPEDNDCFKRQEYGEYPGKTPSSITVDFFAKKPNLLISWNPVYNNNWNWTLYALHYSSAGEEQNIKNMNCILIPKGRHEWILQNGSGWNYPDKIWVAIITYPHRKFDEIDLESFATSPRPPPTFPPTSSDVPTKLIAAIVGAAFGCLLLVFAVLFYRKQINFPWPFSACFREGSGKKIINPPVTFQDEPNYPPVVTRPKKPGPETYYACYFPESPSYQLEVANVVNCFRENGYTVEMDAMNSNERVDLGPTRWAEQQIKNARNVFVFLSPELRRLCASDVEGTDFSQQEHEIRWVELDLIRREYTQTRSQSKMVCIILPNILVNPRDFPAWAEIAYKWPEDKLKIFKRLNGTPMIQPS